jgi:SOS response regulatory protein OraA/RecX
VANLRRGRRALSTAQDGQSGRDIERVAPGRRRRDGEASFLRGGDDDGASPSGRGRDGQASLPRPTAVEFGLAMLAARSWPERKLREKIASRYDQDQVEAAIGRLRELRLVDDEAWAERYARDRFERLGKGRHRIRAELLGKGIDAGTADAALDRAVGGEAERVRAAAMLDALRGRLGGGPATAGEEAPEVDARTRRRDAERLNNRLFRRMLARGFPASLLRDLLDVS